MAKKDLILIGMPGCGKSVIGKRLSRELKLLFVDLDTAIENRADCTIPEIFARGGEEEFRRTETEVFKETVGVGGIIATGGGIVKRAVNKQAAKRGVVIFIDRPLENILSDINISARPLLADGREKLTELYNERYKLYTDWADIRVVNDGSIEDITDKIKEEVLCYENNDYKRS